jgi:adenylate cyclase
VVSASRRVQEDAAGRTPYAFDDLGEQSLKNIARPIRAYKVRMPAEATSGTSEAPSAPLPLPERPSIAVLPFQNMGGDPEQDYFSDGLTEDIITALSKLRGFFVISRNSSFAYKGKSPDIRQVSRDLGVRYVLEGSVRRSGERLRVTAQLIDAATGNHVWAERYDRAIADIFTVQDEITQTVVGTLEPQLYAAEHARLQTSAPESLDAWGYVMRAMPHLWVWASPESIEAAERLLKLALKADPDYARAVSLLAWTHAARAHLGYADAGEQLREGIRLAQRAVDLDINDAWAHVSLGYVHMVSRRYQPALDELTEGIERNPSFALAHMLLGSTYAYGGKSDEGLAEAAIAARLSPRDSIQAATLSVMGTSHFVAGRYAEAADFQRRAVQLRPHFGTAWRSLAAAAGMIGDTDLGKTAVAEVLRLQPDLTLDWVERYHPIVRPEDRALYIEGLRRSGLT